MTLIEVLVATGIMMVIGSALMTLLIGVISIANSAKVRAVATRLADQKMEQVKNAEQTYKPEIQNGNWVNFLAQITAGSPEKISLAAAKDFLTRTTTTSCEATSCQISIVVSWLERGKTTNVTLTTVVSKWL